MTAFALRVRAFAILVCVPALSLSACSGEVGACGNEPELWFNEVLETGCAECVDFSIASSIFLADTFRIRSQPDYRVARCGVARVDVFPDGVSLLLSSDADESLARFRDSITSRSRGTAVLLRLEGVGSPVTVIRAEQLQPYLHIFFREDRSKVQSFIGNLRPGKAVVGNFKLPPEEVRIEHAALTRAKKLLEELDAEVRE